MKSASITKVYTYKPNLGFKIEVTFKGKSSINLALKVEDNSVALGDWLVDSKNLDNKTIERRLVHSQDEATEVFGFLSKYSKVLYKEFKNKDYLEVNSTTKRKTNYQWLVESVEKFL